MVKGVLRFLSREARGLHEAAYVLAIFALGSQLLALVRDRLLASIFGASHTLDLYYAAFRLPDLLFATVASLFSLYALLPVLTSLEAERPGLMLSFLRRTLAVFFLAMSFIAMAAYIFAPAIVPLFAPGFAADPAARAELILLVRVLLLQPILLGASNTIAALTQLRHRFVLYSVSPFLYNLGIIFGAVVLHPLWGTAGLGWGVVFGAAMHLCVQLPYFLSERPGAAVSLPRLTAGLREVLVLSVPRTVALASAQISLLAITAIASAFSAGSIAVFTFAYNLQAVPLTIIGVSYSVAAFPTLARLYARGEREEFARHLESALRHIVFWAVPATVFVIVLRAQIVRTVLGAGQFDWNATRLTAALLALFITSLTAQAVTLLAARAYYASGNTRTPLYFGAVDVVVSIGGALAFLALFDSSPFFRNLTEALLRVGGVGGTPVLMLALGYATGSIAKCAVAYGFFLKDFPVSQKRLARLSFESFGASLIGGAAAYAALLATSTLLPTDTTLGVFLQGLFAGACGLLLTAAVLLFLRNREILEAVGAFSRKFRDTPAGIAVEPTDVA